MKSLLATLFVLLFGVALLAASAPPASGARPQSTDPSADTPSRSPHPLRTWGLGLTRVVGALVGIYLALVVLLLLFESRLVYHPSRYSPLTWTEPPSVEDCAIRTADGLQLHAWWQPAPEPENAPVLLWFHGNAGNLSDRSENLRLWHGRELNTLLIDYRGYGKSQGHPSEKGLYLDGEAAYRYLTEKKSVDPKRIVCLGRSLGAAVALHVALERPVAGVILEGPPASAKAMARELLPLVPVWPFIRSKFDNVHRVRELKVPLLVIHGDRDTVVPCAQGRAVFENAPEPKQFYAVAGAGHNDTYVTGGEAYFDQILGFCRRCTQGN